MTRARATRLAWAGAGASAALAAGGLVLMALNLGGGRVATSDALGSLSSLCFAAAFTVVGALVGARRPANPIGWIFLCAGIGWAAAYLADQYALFALLTERGSAQGGGAAAWLSTWLWLPCFLVPATFALMLFPDGSLPSRRWRLLPWLAGCVFAFGATGQAMRPGHFDAPLEAFSNPFGSSSLGGAWQNWQIVLNGVVLLAVAALVVRYRRAGAEQRTQIKWVMAAAVFLGIVVSTVSPFYGSSRLARVVVTLGIASVPVATGVAILKYRLYEIDRIISRTLVYGALTAGLAGLYFGIVIGLQAAFSGLTRGNDLAIAGSTLAVAALFRPARRRIQGFVDRRFYRRRYDAQQTLETFSARLRDEVDLDQLGADLRAVVHETMQPAHVSLWLRAPEAER